MELQAAQRQNVIPLSDEINATWMKYATECAARRFAGCVTLDIATER